MKELMSTEQLLQGLKHYRRIARQDLLRAAETPHPDAFRLHAEARRALYVALEGQASELGPQDAVDMALDEYRRLPFTTSQRLNDHRIPIVTRFPRHDSVKLPSLSSFEGGI